MGIFKPFNILVLSAISLTVKKMPLFNGYLGYKTAYLLWVNFYS